MASREHCRGALRQALGSSYWIRNGPASRDKQPYNRRSYKTGRMKTYDNRETCHSAEGKRESERLKSFFREVILAMDLKEEAEFCWFKKEEKSVQEGRTGSGHRESVEQSQEDGSFSGPGLATNIKLTSPHSCQTEGRSRQVGWAGQRPPPAKGIHAGSAWPSTTLSGPHLEPGSRLKPIVNRSNWRMEFLWPSLCNLQNLFSIFFSWVPGCSVSLPLPTLNPLPLRNSAAFPAW